jgi:hypothetical protein
MARPSLIARRPAETAGGLVVVALNVAHVLGVTDPAVLTAIGTAAGLVGTAITFVVSHGGIRGIWRTLAGGTGAAG